MCDGLKHLPDSIEQVWPQTIVQTCVVHLLRNTYAYASRKDWSEIARTSNLYTRRRSRPRSTDSQSSVTNGRNAIPRSSGSDQCLAEFVPFLQFDNAIRQVIYTTNAIESVNARIRRASRPVDTFRPRPRP